MYNDPLILSFIMKTSQRTNLLEKSPPTTISSNEKYIQNFKKQIIQILSEQTLTDETFNNISQEIAKLLDQELLASKSNQTSYERQIIRRDIQRQLYQYGIIKICPYSDWKVERKNKETAISMRLLEINAHLRIHLTFLEKNGIKIEKKMSTFFDVGSGDGTAIKEIDSGYEKRDNDLHQGKTLKNYYDSFGITKEYLFSLDTLLLSLVKPEHIDTSISECIKILSNLLIQKMNIIQDYEFPPEGNHPDGDIAMLDTDINVLKKILPHIQDYNLFPQNNISNILLSTEFPQDTKGDSISKNCIKRLNELINTPQSFLEKYFSLEGDLRDSISVYTTNTLLGKFQNMKSLLSEYNLSFDVINACRSTSHLDNNDYKTTIQTLCENLQEGGVIRDDGIIESCTRYIRHTELIEIQKKLGEQYRFLVTIEEQLPPFIECIITNDSSSLYSPKNVVIQKALISSKGEKIFYETEEQNKLTDIRHLCEKNLTIIPLSTLQSDKKFRYIRYANSIREKLKKMFQQYELVSLHQNPDKELYKARTHFTSMIHERILELVFTYMQVDINLEDTPCAENINVEGTINNIIYMLLKMFPHLENMNGLGKDRITFEYKNTPIEIDYFYKESTEIKNPKTLFYIHGLGCSKREFMEAIPHEKLSKYNIVAIDLPGCGNSPYPDDWKKNDFQLEMKHLIDIIHLSTQKLGIKNCIYVGHSMGGLIGLEYSKQHPEQLSAFINIEGDLDPKDNVLSRGVIASSKEDFVNIRFQQERDQLEQSGSKGMKRYGQLMYRAADPGAYYDYSKAIVEYCNAHPDLLQQFLNIGSHPSGIPTIYIHGDQTQYASIEKIDTKLVQTACIKNSDHFPMYDNPHDFYEAITAFADGIPKKDTKHS